METFSINISRSPINDSKVKKKNDQVSIWIGLLDKIS